MVTDLRVENWIKTNGLSIPVEGEDGNYTLTPSDGFVTGDGTITITLPLTASLNTGKMYWIKNKGTGILTVVCSGDETIDEETSQEIVSLDCMAIVSDGTEWWII